MRINKSRIYILITLLVLSGISACNKDNTTAPPATKLTEKRLNDVPYGNDSRNKMDVALPENRNNETPFVLLIHGGSWVSGDKGDMKAIQDSLLVRGIASASINYRYASGTVHFEEQMEDVKRAMDLCSSNADEWQIRGDKYIIGGVSAGAHMSMLYGHRFNNTHSIGAIVSAAGPTDLTDIDWLNYAAIIGQLDNIQKMVGASYIFGQALDTRFAAASPVKGIRNIPTLMIHGNNDLVVAYSQSQRMEAAMNNASFPNKLVTINGANHDLNFGNPATAHLIIEEISGWVTLYGK